MISFTDITESTLHSRNISKKKATTEQILTQLKKKEQNEDLILCTLWEEIATLIETVMLHNKDNNSLFIINPHNTPIKEQTAVSNEETRNNSDNNETTIRENDSSEEAFKNLRNKKKNTRKTSF